jgi:hypothetical protein
MVAWMFDSGQFTPHTFAARAKALGYEWAALELDDYGNAVRWPAFRDECEAIGILPGGWFTTGANIVDTPADAGFAIAEHEGQGDYEGIANAIAADRLPDCPLAICTNFNTPLYGGGADARAAAEVLIGADFSCLTEAYMNENLNASPDRLDAYARHLGWDTSQPVFGVYPVAGQPVPSYAKWQDWPGVDYLGEYVM